MKRYINSFVILTIISLILSLSACTPTLNKAIKFGKGETVDIIDGNIADVDASTDSVNVNSQVAISNDIKINLNLALDELKDLNGNSLLDENQGNCAPYATPQPYAFSGSSAGFAKTNNAVGAYEHALQLKTKLTSFGDFSENVAIIIIDDFAGTTTGIEGFGQSREDLMASFNANDSTTWPIHGDVVLNHINLLLSASGYRLDAYEYLELEGARANWSHPQGSKLTIELHDFNTAKTMAISQRLSNSIEQLEAEGFKNIVVNMSFAITPCSVWNDYVAHIESYKTIEEYAAAIYKKNEAALSAKIDLDIYGENVVLPELMLKLTTAVNPLSDPLYQVIKKQNNLVFIASAGNFGNDFSTYPAAYPNVIAVSALDLASNKKAGYANKGNVLIAGGEFLLEFIDSGIIKSNISYKGSSFAAPELSYIAALNLASGSNCKIISNKDDLELTKALSCN